MSRLARVSRLEDISFFCTVRSFVRSHQKNTMVAIKIKNIEGCFILHDVPGDGNCFFHALCKHPYFSSMKHDDLRKELVQRANVALAENGIKRKIMENLYSLTLALDQSFQTMKVSSISDYIDNIMSKDGQYAGDFEAILLSLLF